jgi:Cu/Ag efflux pump CusA
VIDNALQVRRQPVFAKLIVVILTIGIVACMLLTVRQQRLQAVHDIANIQRRVAEKDRALAEFRVDLAVRLTPERIEAMTRGIGPFSSFQSVQSSDRDRTETLAVDPSETRRGLDDE